MGDGDGTGFSMGRSDLLASLESRYPSVAAAMPALVDAAVRRGQVDRGRSRRLTELYTSWMSDTPWSRTVMTHTNRPSLASWDGWPWDAMCVADSDCLQRGVRGM